MTLRTVIDGEALTLAVDDRAESYIDPELVFGDALGRGDVGDMGVNFESGRALKCDA